jgi:type IV pilus assembly protein PilY1
LLSETNIKDAVDGDRERGSRIVKKTTIRRILAMLATTFFAASAGHAEDIDIYGGNGGSALPNIVIVFDNASRNNSNFSGTCTDGTVSVSIAISNLQDATRCALAITATYISQQTSLLGQFRLGMLVYGYQNNQGGQWIVPSITPGAQNVSTPLPLMDQNGINNFIAAVTPPIGTANNASSSGGMQEAWAFLTGSPQAATEVFGSNTTYTSKIGLACQKSFVIFIGAATGNNGEPETGNSGAAGGAAGLANAGATAAQQVQINTSNIGPNTGDDSAWGDEWARFMYQTDFNNNQNDRQNIVTYTIATGGTRPNYVQFLQSMANQGGGKAFVSADIKSMVQALLQIFNEIAAINSVFASSSLPVSANTQGTYLNQVFIGMFRPDASDNPRWLGNLKQYQFGVGGTASNPTLFLADSTGASALSSAGTGFISPNAVSFWTSKDVSKLPDSIGGFYVKNPQSAGGGYDSPDGELVEKGGVGQQLRLANLQDDYVANPTTPRNLYTCNGACAGGSNGPLKNYPFATTNNPLNTAAAFGISSQTYTASVFSITRSGSSATLTLTSPASPAISLPTSITLSGSTGGVYDGSFASASPTVSPSPPTATTSVSWAVNETPTAAPSGTYTATGPGTPTTSITNVSRTQVAGLNTATVTVSDITFGTGTALSVGASVSVTGITDSNSSPSTSNPYNGQKTVTAVNTGSKTFSYTFTDLPAIPDGGGTFCIGTKCAGSKVTGTIDSSGAALPGLVRGTGQVLMINFPSGTPLSSTTQVIAGNSVTISGNTNYGFNNIGTVTATGAACTVSYVNGLGNTVTYTGAANTTTVSGGKTTYNYTSVCVDISSGVIKVSPNLTAQSQSSATATMASGSFISTITTMTRGASNCPTSNMATVSVTTASPYLFANNASVTIAGTNQGQNEGAYNGAFTITTTGTNTFTFQVATAPACTDNKSGMKISYQSSTNAINVGDLINWVRGDDNVGDESSPDPGVITVRPSVHGDVLHSRPAVVNYGGSIGVVVFYGDNGGIFHAVNGNQPINSGNTIGSAPPGGEIFGFIPTEFYSKLVRLYQNSPAVLLSTTPTGLNPTPTPKDYFFDGSTSVYQNGSTVYLFLSARRGGQFIYALDVSDPTNPIFMWKVTTTNIPKLGYTWSTPKAARVRGYANPVVIFGGGYDPNEDNEPPTTDTMGAGIYILDATTGALVWNAEGGGAGTFCNTNPCKLAGMTYAIPADVTLINRDFDTNGYIDRLYAADTGGNIWRVDLEANGYASTNVGPSTWQVSQFASLGGSGATPRKFFYPPDAVATKTYDIVLATTGDREHPMYSASSTKSYAIVNRFYALKDKYPGPDSSASTPIVDGTSSTANAAVTGVLTDQTPGSTQPTPYNFGTATDSGYYITLGQTSRCVLPSTIDTPPCQGEKGVNAPLTIGGFVYFGTSQPPTPNTQACNNLGTARGYQIDLFRGCNVNSSGQCTGVSGVDFKGGGLPPSPVGGLVEVNVNGSTRAVPFCLGCGSASGTGPDATSPLGGGKPPIPVNPIRKRVYWYIEKHDT